MSTPLQAAEAMVAAVINRDLDGVLDSFTSQDDAYMYVEGPRWTTRGGNNVAAGWRAYFESSIRINNFHWVEGPFTFETPELAQVMGVIDYDISGEGENGRLRLRMTWLLRLENGRWRIIHEHGSQPLADPYGAGDWWPAGAKPFS